MEEHPMPVVQIALEISDKIAAGLASGEFVRHAGTIRSAGGAIVEHLPEAKMAVKSSMTSVSRIAENLKDPKVLILLGIGAAVVVGLVAVTQTNKAKQDAEALASGENYNAALNAYLIAIQRGTMDASILSNLIASLDTLQHEIESEQIAIEGSSDQTASLLSIAREYTIKLAEANSVDVGDLPVTAPATASESIQILRRYLGIQKKIINEAE